MAGTGLQKARIKVYGAEVHVISCLFNPAEYQISSSAKYTDGDEPQFVGEFQSTLTLSLYFDVTENLAGNEKLPVSVVGYTSEIQNLLLVDGALHKPPMIEFIWGDMTFKGYLTALQQHFNYFDIEGKPLRAKLDLTISSDFNPTADRKSPKESPDRTKQRRITEGTSLWKLAWEEYGDCNQWEIIAEYNHLMSPFDIRPGQIIHLPAQTD